MEVLFQSAETVCLKQSGDIWSSFPEWIADRKEHGTFTGQPEADFPFRPFWFMGEE
jgi:hypothetical protein